MAPARVRLRVEGRVQGVGFRWFVREAARRADVAGTVRNLPDGSVEIDVEGPPEALAALEQAARDGPPGARVAAVRRVEPDGPLDPLPRPFTVLR